MPHEKQDIPNATPGATGLPFDARDYKRRYTDFQRESLYSVGEYKRQKARIRASLVAMSTPMRLDFFRDLAREFDIETGSEIPKARQVRVRTAC